ncbi:unnamed protein product, partial [Clonostachys rhizophaga]
MAHSPTKDLDMDVTPKERRVWGSWIMLGYWFSDAVQANAWQSPAAVLAMGLTWREALIAVIFGPLTNAVPLVLNGMIGARLFVPFPVIARASFGWYFYRVAVGTRVAAALFWHGYQTYTGTTALTQVIRCIWPSYLDIPNHIPESVGITTQGMLSFFLFWVIQFPFMLATPHKLKWLFVLKGAGGAGDMWNLPYEVHGSERSWMVMSAISGTTGGWATLSVNIPDFTRYLKNERAVWWQIAFLPGVKLWLGLIAIICTSAGKVVYGECKTPLPVLEPRLSAKWTTPGGTALCFFFNLSWVIAQIMANLSTNVITAANDICCIWPKWVNIRRGALLTTIVACWALQPWQVVKHATSILTFMSGVGIFLAPMAAIIGADYWVVHRQRYDVPALYKARGRYRHGVLGTNWRAVVAIVVSLGPSMPGFAASLDTSLKPYIGNAIYVYYMYYFYGFTSAFAVYSGLSYLFPARETYVPHLITGEESLTPTEGVDMEIDTEKNGTSKVYSEEASKSS